MEYVYLGINEDGLLMSGAWDEDSILPEGQSHHRLEKESMDKGIGIGWYWDGSNYSEPTEPELSLQDCVDMKVRLLDDSYKIVVDYFEQTQAIAVGIVIEDPITEESFKNWLNYRSKLKAWDPIPGNPIPEI